MLNSRMEMTKKDVSDLEDRSIKWSNLNNRVLWENNNRYNIHEIGISEGKEKDFIAGKNIFKEIMAEKIPNLKKDIHLQVQETE